MFGESPEEVRADYLGLKKRPAAKLHFLVN